MEKSQKRKIAFYICSFAYTLERFSFYSGKWLISIFVATAIGDGGLGLTIADGVKLQSNLVAFTYLAPVIGGYISDRYIGAKYLIPIGMILMGIGWLIGWKATNVAMVNLMILLCTIGTGLFKSQNAAIIGRLFDNKEDLDGAFSIQYSFINAGSFVGTLIIGVISVTRRYSFCFLICGIMMFIDAIWFIYGWRYLGDTGKQPFKINEHEDKKNLYFDDFDDFEPLTKPEKKSISAIMIISLFSVIFWIFWYLAYMPVYYYWGGENAAANWMIGNFKIPSIWFDSLNALMCMILGPIFGKLWSKTSVDGTNRLSMVKKIALGIIIIGFSYAILAIADVVRGDNLAPIYWIAIVCIVFSVGELVFSPLGYSYVAKYAPPRLLSVMMSVWSLSIFFAGKSYSWIYEYTLKYEFANAYFAMAGIAIVAGVVLWILDKRLRGFVRK